MFQANRFTKVENLETLTNLEEIYLSDQGIDDISQLAILVSLFAFTSVAVLFRFLESDVFLEQPAGGGRFQQQPCFAEWCFRVKGVE